MSMRAATAASVGLAMTLAVALPHGAQVVRYATSATGHAAAKSIPTW